MAVARAFRGFRFPAEVILWAVRWYLRFPVSYRDLERMLADRGVEVDHATMYPWVQRFAPELEKRLRRRHLRPCRGPCKAFVGQRSGDLEVAAAQSGAALRGRRERGSLSGAWRAGPQPHGAGRRPPPGAARLQIGRAHV